MRPDYVVAYLGSSLGRIQIDAVSRQIAGMTNINAEELTRSLLVFCMASICPRLSPHQFRCLPHIPIGALDGLARQRGTLLQCIDAYARRIVGWRVSRTAHASSSVANPPC
jgi:hypothetical protein